MWSDKGIDQSLLDTSLLSENMILKTDSYKIGHWLMLPNGTQGFFSYAGPRGFIKGLDKAVFWGLNLILRRCFSKKLTMADVRRAKRFSDRHLGPGIFNEEGWNTIVTEFGGNLPLRVRAIPEGSVTRANVAPFTVECTDPRFGWLVSYFEPLWLQSWHASTVASISLQSRINIGKYWKETVDDDRQGGLDFALHDFGFRGVSSVESAGGGSGHLLSFFGTDTMQAIAVLYDFYGLDEADDASMPAFSVLATEHSVMGANADAANKNDYEALRMAVNLLSKRGKGAIVSAVADLYEPFRFAKWVSTDFKEQIEQSGGRFVVRPDSGVPKDVVLQIIEILMEGFGYTINKKGYRVLPDCIRVLQGDGINIYSIPEILEHLKLNGISAENIVFGMGGGLLQHCDRDWMKYAMKGAAINVDGEWKDIYKEPITDPGKTSLRGRITTVMREGEFVSVRIEDVLPTDVDMMAVVFEDGEIFNEPNFNEARSSIQKYAADQIALA